ncbi:hypothetical protein AC622_09710 [Bacillus sp. FJAT-27916]|uniref:IclR family transcriptional regulator n=1 Tax=Bacillus sp. FJAT-27916 TaxID=1679169 RepID=UPI000670965A|nr:IclR family transcriptional regulator [Bacillus sp. FJAT-27916]KMY44489.1 hypothetical protein AC622_09710 [Bacillus sp. FJAT-27916]
MNQAKEKQKYNVPALENAFSILRLLSRNRFKESTITEISNALNLNPATCYRLLRVMEEMAVVRYMEDKKRYTLGPYLVVLGERAKEHLDYLLIIQPYLERLAKDTQMTAILVNKINDRKLAIVSKAEASDFGVTVSVGRHFSISDGSFGLCLLAYLDKEKRKDILHAGTGLKTYTETEIEAMEKELDTLKKRGYHITYGEYVKGLCGIAAPLLTHGDKVEMSIELIGFTSRHDKADLEGKGLLIKEAAMEISRKLKGDE